MRPFILLLFAISAMLLPVWGSSFTEEGDETEFVEVESTADPWSNPTQWCLALQQDGASKTLNYESSFWTDSKLLNADGNIKTDAFMQAFTAIKVEMCDATYPMGSLNCNSRVTTKYNDYGSLKDMFSGIPLHSAFSEKGGQWSTGFDWRRMMPGGANDQPSCNLNGVNLHAGMDGKFGYGFNWKMRTRFGIMFNNENDCHSVDAMVGFGMTISWGHRDYDLTCGNFYGCCGTVRRNPLTRIGVGRLYIRPKNGKCPEGTSSAASKSSRDEALLVKIESIGKDARSASAEDGNWSDDAASGIGALVSTVASERPVIAIEWSESPKKVASQLVRYTFNIPARISALMFQHGPWGEEVTRVSVFNRDLHVSLGSFDVVAKGSKNELDNAVFALHLPPNVQSLSTVWDVIFETSQHDSRVKLQRLWPIFHKTRVPWCLALQINGASRMMNYDVPQWTDNSLINAEGNIKTKAFFSAFSALKLEFCESNQCNVRTADIGLTASLRDLFRGPPRQLGLDMKTIMPFGNNIQPHCNWVGVNSATAVPGATRVRLGILMNNENDCNTVDSMIGMGLEYSAWYSRNQRQITAGNWVGCCQSETQYPVLTHPAIARIYVYPIDGKCPATLPASFDGARGEKGPKGPPGLPGSDGKNGAQGPRGARGPAGKDGAPGPAGIPGPAGPRGSVGDRGIVGLEGPQGQRGPTGDKGEPGISITGPQGPQGVPGMQGAPGLKGEKGLQGIEGDRGDVGPVGEAGLKGETGDRGLQGPIGKRGSPGTEGKAGPQGSAGDPGPKGPKGDVGPEGDEGLPGPAGPQGVPGVDGHIVRSDGTSIEGPQGVPGKDSTDGKNGLNGKDGIDGADAPPAKNGEQGKPGVKGVKGARGDQGDKGEKGERGDKGPRGEQGPQGMQGFKGKTGPQGDKGPQGKTGAIGPKPADKFDSNLPPNLESVAASFAVVPGAGGFSTESRYDPEYDNVKSKYSQQLADMD